ncbi:MAG: sulfite exporter TauE/SafE family protein [Desulfovibrionaceae bacterium]|nr:sulfite exporter TauE/SafE family protein [Desulfovibrionaceae bacterium]
MYFPTAEITCNPLFPFFVAFAISLCTSTAGVSGGFLLLPFQMSILGYTNPSVSATNHFFNILACPAGVLRYAREGRLLWPIAVTTAIGTLPGVFIGAVIRLELLPDPHDFRIFAGVILLLLGLRMAKGVIGEKRQASLASEGNKQITLLSFDSRAIVFSFRGEEHSISTKPLAVLSLVVGLIGGIYGIGGGAFISPILITIMHVPVYVVAGATLLSTAIASLAGVLSFSFLSFFYTSLQASPDLRLGLCIGLGGMIGMYLGARLQKYVPAKWIKVFLVVIVLGTAFKYLFL